MTLNLPAPWGPSLPPSPPLDGSTTSRQAIWTDSAYPLLASRCHIQSTSACTCSYQWLEDIHVHICPTSLTDGTYIYIHIRMYMLRLACVSLGQSEHVFDPLSLVRYCPSGYSSLSPAVCVPGSSVWCVYLYSTYQEYMLLYVPVEMFHKRSVPHGMCTCMCVLWKWFGTCIVRVGEPCKCSLRHWLCVC